jgi:hypothetical protein
LTVSPEAGYRYSSSIYPIRHDHYGMPNAPRFAHRVRDGLLELPVTTLRFSTATGRPAVVATSACCRMRCRAGCCRRSTSSISQPAIFYFHPWEIDAAQPRIAGISAKTRFRHYVNLQYTEGR